MHALSMQIACLLVAQYGADASLNQSPMAPAPVQAAFSDDASQFRPTVGNAAAQPSAAPNPQPTSRPTSLTPTTPVHSPASLSRAEALVKQFVAWDPAAMEGESVTLLDCVERAANTGQQSATIAAYWELCLAVGRYAQTVSDLGVLANVSPQSEFEQAQIVAAERSAGARQAQARVDLLAAQEKLAEVARLPEQTLPLPADVPFVGKYHTRLTTMYAGRAIPRQVRKVDRLLPHQLKLIEQRAEAVDANVRLTSNMVALYQQGQIPLSGLLTSCGELSVQQETFLQAVIAYNQQIATYSQTVVGTSLPAASLVSTLIRQPAAAASPRLFRDENVLPASAQQRDVPPRQAFGESRFETQGPGNFDAPRRAANLDAPRGAPTFDAPRSDGNFDPSQGNFRAAQGAGTGEFSQDNVGPTPDPVPSRRRIEPSPPAAQQAPAFDPNASFQINDGT